MHLSGSSFVDAVRALIGERRRNADSDANRRPRKLPRGWRGKPSESGPRPKSRRATESSAARIVARLQPVAGTPGETYLRDVRHIDVNHWAVRRALEDVETLGWCERTYFGSQTREPFHELHGQWLGAIVGILTDPVTGERTGGITRTYHPPGPQDRQGEVARRSRAAGDHPPVARRRGVDRPACLRGDRVGAVGDDAMGFCPMWAIGSTVADGSFPVLAGIECLTIVADNDRGRGETGSQGRARGLPAVGRRRPRGGDEDPEKTGGRRQRHSQAEGACMNEKPEDFPEDPFNTKEFKPEPDDPAHHRQARQETVAHQAYLARREYRRAACRLARRGDVLQEGVALIAGNGEPTRPSSPSTCQRRS